MRTFFHHMIGILGKLFPHLRYSVLPDKNALELGADSSSNQKYMKGKHELLTEYDFWSHQSKKSWYPNQIKAEDKDIFSKHSFLRNIVWVGEYEQKEKYTGGPLSVRSRYHTFTGFWPAGPLEAGDCVPNQPKSIRLDWHTC